MSKYRCCPQKLFLESEVPHTTKTIMELPEGVASRVSALRNLGFRKYVRSA